MCREKRYRVRRMRGYETCIARYDVATDQMLAGEMRNTAIEAIGDSLETRENEKIRVIKDIAAAAAYLRLALISFD